MDHAFRGDVRILFGDAVPGMHSLLRQTLAGAGFTAITEAHTVADFAEMLAASRPDILILDIAMPGGDICALVHKMRHSEIGRDPFLPVLLTTWDTEATLVRRAVNAGVDDLLKKPLSIGTMIERIETIALARKPFVVTADYIGPDRRRAVDRGESSIPLVVVPNTLRQKLSGQPADDNAARKAMDEAFERVNTLRLRQSAFRIAFVARQVVPMIYAGTDSPEIPVLLGDLIVSTQEIRRRIEGTPLGHVAQLCDQLLRPAETVRARGIATASDAEGRKALDLVKALADAVLAFFNPDKQAEALAEEVNNAIEGYRQRMAQRRARG